MIKMAKFNIGDIVTHDVQGYRAIIVDVDPIFQPSGRFNPKATKYTFATRNPWYRLLVDESSQETYVEECHLQLDANMQPINNPNVETYLIERQGIYRLLHYRH